VSVNFLRNQNLTNNRLAQALVRTAYPNGSICSVRRGPLKGLQFKVSPGMGFTYVWGIGVEQWEFRGLVRPGMCVFDIGANCGQSTLSLARMVGATGRVVAFEPIGHIFANLVFNLKLNPSLKVVPVCAAASGHNGRADFLFDSEFATQGHLALVEPDHALPNAKKISVRAIRLDDYMSENWPVPQFMKIDVEGGAGSVLGGAQTLIGLHRPTIYIELHGPEEQTAVGELLAKHGYKAQTLSGETIPDPAAGWFSPLVCKPSEQA
jgi:FkbM family methyltransferase